MRIVSCTQGGGWNFEPKNGYLNFAVGVGTTTNNYMADFASQIKNSLPHIQLSSP